MDDATAEMTTIERSIFPFFFGQRFRNVDCKIGKEETAYCVLSIGSRHCVVYKPIVIRLHSRIAHSPHVVDVARK